jgi:hypothetical protein
MVIAHRFVFVTDSGAQRHTLVPASGATCWRKRDLQKDGTSARSSRPTRSRSFLVRSRECSALPTCAVRARGGGDALTRYTRERDRRSASSARHRSVYLVSYARASSRVVYSVLTQLPAASSYEVRVRDAGSERAARVSDRQDGGVPGGAVVTERCMSHVFARQRVFG